MELLIEMSYRDAHFLQTGPFQTLFVNADLEVFFGDLSGTTPREAKNKGY
jgi:hypothetical protein